MSRITSFATALLLLSCIDVPQVYPLRPKPVNPAAAELPVVVSPPDLFLAVAQSSAQESGTLQPQSRLAIIRYVDGEFAHVVKPIPARRAFKYKVGQPLDDKVLHQALLRGSAANPGDQVQITNVDIREKEIVISINGGTRKKINWRQHIQISMGPMPTTQTVSAPTGVAQLGAELILDFGQAVPDLTPDELKKDLSPFLDFSGERSAAVNWVETLPPEFQKAIKDRTAVVGMNHDMVLAAMGRPDQKVREYDEDGNETEDWIYGHPPTKTVLVTFSGDKVVRVKEY